MKRTLNNYSLVLITVSYSMTRFMTTAVIFSLVNMRKINSCLLQDSLTFCLMRLLGSLNDLASTPSPELAITSRVNDVIMSLASNSDVKSDKKSTNSSPV